MRRYSTMICAFSSRPPMRDAYPVCRAVRLARPPPLFFSYGLRTSKLRTSGSLSTHGRKGVGSPARSHALHPPSNPPPGKSRALSAYPPTNAGSDPARTEKAHIPAAYPLPLHTIGGNPPASATVHGLPTAAPLRTSNPLAANRMRRYSTMICAFSSRPHHAGSVNIRPHDDGTVGRLARCHALRPQLRGDGAISPKPRPPHTKKCTLREPAHSGAYATKAEGGMGGKSRAFPAHIHAP